MNNHQRAVQQVVLGLSILLGGGGMAAAQDVETVKANVLKSLAKIEGYSVGVVKGRWIRWDVIGIRLNSGIIETSALFHFRDRQMWIEFDERNLNERRAAEVQAIRKARGTEGLLNIWEFDGKTSYAFDPHNLELIISPWTELPSHFALLPLLPQNSPWAGIRHNASIASSEIRTTRSM